MATFEPAYKFALKWEGGYSNVSGDKGGETYRGITRKNNPSWSGWKVIDANAPVPHGAFIESADALHFDYAKKNYWDKYELGEIENQNVANVIFDFVWLSGSTGIKTAIKTLEAITGKKFSKWSAGTIAAINSLRPSQYVEKLLAVRKDFFAAIVNKDASQQKFLKGWLNRLQDLASSTGSFLSSTKGRGGLVALAAILVAGYIISDGRK